jgi:hypothetical protein
VIERHRVHEAADVIDHQIARQAAQHRRAFGQVAPVALQLDVPAERVHARRHGLENVPGQDASPQHVKADAARARSGQPLQLGIAHRTVDDHDRTRPGAEFGDRIHRAAIVGAVSGRLDHDRALEPEALLHPAVVRDPRRRRQERRGRRHRIARRRVVEVDVGVGGAGGRLQPRPILAHDDALFGPAHQGAGTRWPPQGTSAPPCHADPDTFVLARRAVQTNNVLPALDPRLRSISPEPRAAPTPCPRAGPRLIRGYPAEHQP